MSCVYFFYAPVANKVKIGVSDNWETRLATVKSHSPIDVICIGTINYTPDEEITALEAKLHRKFRHYRSHGEWFSVFGEMQEYLQTFYQVNRYKIKG